MGTWNFEQDIEFISILLYLQSKQNVKQRSDITTIYPVFITVPKEPKKLPAHKLYTSHSTVISGQYRSTEVWDLSLNGGEFEDVIVCYKYLHRN